VIVQLSYQLLSDKDMSMSVKNRSILSIILIALLCVSVLTMAPLPSSAQGPAGEPQATVFLPMVASNSTAHAEGSHMHTGPFRMPRIASHPLGQPSNAPQPRSSQPQLALVANPTIDAKILLISADGNEPSLAAITQTLDYMATPYTLWIATQRPNQLTSDQLFSGSHGYYHGVILTTGSLAYTPDNGETWLSGLSSAEWNNLWSYEANFGIRQATWYTYPTPDYGFGSPTAVDTQVTPVPATLTAAGQAVFSYFDAARPITIQNAYTYLAPVADSNTTSLLADTNGNALAAIHTYADGRENLALTFDSNQYLVHNLEISYGVINWVTKGRYLGDFRVYLSVQPDDYFLPDDIWTPETPCGTNLDTDPTGVTYRMDASAVQTLVAWQNAKRAQSVTRDLRLSFPFNGDGVVNGPANDTLVPATQQFMSQFFWINHTFTHYLLTNATYDRTSTELDQNNVMARTLGLPYYSRASMISPEISGLFNQQAMQALYDRGVRYTVWDTSHPEQGMNRPNYGTYNSVVPSILMIPRRANNLFYNVSQPDEWVAEYNCLYSSFWGRDLTYDEILDKESDVLVQYLLRGEMDPWMFHVTNIRAYDGTHMLITDLLDRTFAKYSYVLPLKNITMDTLGKRLAERMQYLGAQVIASFTPGVSITLTAQQPTVIPVTGLRNGGAVELYGGQYTSYIRLSAGQSITLPLQ
jgi:hypothetical protein